MLDNPRKSMTEMIDKYCKMYGILLIFPGACAAALCFPNPCFV